MTPFQLHKQRWESCDLCSLCETRRKVVLVRGQLPCDVLFIGEAPGVSEDALGVPFVGPAGHLLDRIVSDAMYAVPSSSDLRMAWTNLVGCIPRGDDGKKTAEPPEESIKKCAPRLVELVKLCQPRMIVLVGKLPKRHVSGQAQFGDCEWLDDDLMKFVEIVHPASILRADVSQKGLMIQRTTVVLADAFEDLVVPF